MLPYLAPYCLVVLKHLDDGKLYVLVAMGKHLDGIDILDAGPYHKRLAVGCGGRNLHFAVAQIVAYHKRSIGVELERALEALRLLGRSGTL